LLAVGCGWWVVGCWCLGGFDLLAGVLELLELGEGAGEGAVEAGFVALVAGEGVVAVVLGGEAGGHKLSGVGGGGGERRG
jgi:hypothetical protein